MHSSRFTSFFILISTLLFNVHLNMPTGLVYQEPTTVAEQLSAEQLVLEQLSDLIVQSVLAKNLEIEASIKYFNCDAHLWRGFEFNHRLNKLLECQHEQRVKLINQSKLALLIKPIISTPIFNYYLNSDYKPPTTLS